MLGAMFAMFLLTMVVAVFAFLAKRESVRNNSVDIDSYLLNNNQDLPAKVIKTNRNLNNQFEVPMLFYVACLAYLCVGVESVMGVFFAWAFVLTRIAHAYIHITYNELNHRMLAFTAGLVMVIGLWLNLMIQA